MRALHNSRRAVLKRNNCGGLDLKRASVMHAIQAEETAIDDVNEGVQADSCSLQRHGMAGQPMMVKLEHMDIHAAGGRA